MTEDELFVVEEDEEQEAPEIQDAPASGAAFDFDGFLNELVRSQSKKKLEIASEIEEQVDALVEGLGTTFKTFLAKDCDLKFKDMSIVQSLPVPGSGTPDYLLGLCRSGEIPVACFRFQNATARNLLSLALVGRTVDKRSDEKLSMSESRLVMVLIDLLVATFFRANTKLAEMKEPAPARRIERENFLELIRDDDWVKFDFPLAVDDTKIPICMIAPLALFNGQGLVQDNEDEQEAEVVVDTEWQKCMFDNIENLKIPINLELGSAEIPLSDIDRLEPGQTIAIEIDADRLKLSTDHGQNLAWAGLQIKGGVMELKILEAAERGQS